MSRNERLPYDVTRCLGLAGASFCQERGNCLRCLCLDSGDSRTPFAAKLRESDDKPCAHKLPITVEGGIPDWVAA